MDIDQTHAAAEIMLEYDGCIMQRQARWGVNDTGWHDVPLSSAGNWDWVTFLYRKKPEPKTIWVNEYGREVCAHATKDKAVFSCTRITATREAIEYREVIE